AEKRQPQDGRLKVDVAGRRIDMRVSTLPVTNGEKVVIRVIDTSRSIVALPEMGMQNDDLDRLKGYLERPQGIVLVTGPTGSGKSTLLYGALRHIQHETKNIVTVEDPVEVQIRGINQVQVEEKAKKTFRAALRAILLQVTEPLRSLINQNVPDSTIRRGAIEDGMRTIGEDGLHKVMEGHTTLEEVTRVVYLAEQGAKISPSCKTVLSQEFENCPACGEFVGENCKHCRRRLDPEWKHCPGCG